jgi:hypothetical protein
VKTAALAAILTRDLLRTEEPTKTETSTCFACGRPMLHRPTDSDDNSRFCSIRCQEAYYVVGLPPHEAVAEQFKKLSQLPFTASSNLRVVAGAPGLTSFDPFKGSKQLSRGIRRRGSSGNGMVRPCSSPASVRCWQGAPKTRSTPCHRNSTAQLP